MPLSPIVVRVPSARPVPATRVPTTSLHTDPHAERRPQLRRYFTTALQPGGQIVENRHIAPALPVFEQAFCAFSRGSLVETNEGHLAIEDLMPGDKVVTTNGQAQTVIWIGRTTIVPGQEIDGRRRMPLTRITTDAFGVARPSACLIAGPAARLLYTPTHLRAVNGDAKMLTPTSEFIDGVTVAETAPPNPVELFHICLARHSVIRVGGLEFESFHPGNNAARKISHAMRDVFLNLFPHANYLTSFGPLVYPRSDDNNVHAFTG